MISTNNLVWRYFRRYKAAFAVGGILLVGTSAFGLTIPWLLKLCVEALQGIDKQGTAPVQEYALLLVGAALVQMAMRIGSRMVIFGAGRNIEFDIRNELLGHLEVLPPSYYAGQSTGDIISRASNDISNVRLLFGPAFLNVINTSFTLVSALIMMLIIDVQLTLLGLLPVPIVIFSMRKIGASLSRQFLDVQQFLGTFSGQIQETLAGVLVIKAFSREAWATKTFDQVNEENFTRNLKLAKTRGLMMPMMGAVGGLGTFVILLFGGYAVIEQRITLGDFVAFNGYLAMLVWPMLALGWVFAMLQRGTAAAKRINEVLTTEAAIRSPATPISLPAGGGALQFNGVSSLYNVKGTQSRVALQNFTLDIPAGSFIGITGPVGSGKSTLLRSLLRLQEITSGTVRLDGADIMQLSLDELRSAIGYVPQEPFLFSTTVQNNIAFGMPGATQEAIEGAALTAGLAKDVQDFPRGYKTVVGERGITLSGGQRQRVALARALLRDPRVLLLDDALSAVDSQTEDEILERLMAFMKTRTSIMATHRLASICKADLIVVLDHGIMVESGRHAELVANQGLYAKLWERQQLAREIEAL